MQLYTAHYYFNHYYNTTYNLVLNPELITFSNCSFAKLFLIRGRLIRMFQRPAGELPQATAPPTPPQTKYDVGARTVPLAGQCFNPKNVPFLQWSKRGDGSFDGTLRMSAATVTTSQFVVRDIGSVVAVIVQELQFKSCNCAAPVVRSIRHFHERACKELHYAT
eukprot:9263-Heterococcus_DN1.PRE.4